MEPTHSPQDPTPSAIDIVRDLHVGLTWSDGLQATLPLAAVRANCPCAECRGARERGNVPGGGAIVTIVDAEFVGAWGLSLSWSDGHATGIFSWELLRSWAEDPDLESLA